jgi:hypothetical protein
MIGSAVVELECIHSLPAKLTDHFGHHKEKYEYYDVKEARSKEVHRH